MTVRLRGRLPAEEMNGLERLEREFAANPQTKRLVIGVVDVYQRADKHGDGNFEPTIELVQVEALEGKFRERGVKLLQAAYGKRTGARQLAGFEDDAFDEDGEPTEPAAPQSTGGPHYLFEPGADSKWWLVLRDEDGTLLARQGGLGIRADLTLGRTYTLDEIDALGDDDLSTLARRLEQEAQDAEFEAAAPDDVAPDEQDQDPNEDEEN